VNCARERFAHVILFQCPQCQGPLASAFTSSNSDMKSLDGGQFGAVCRCGWIGDGLGLLAVNKSVQPWESVCEAPPPVERDNLRDYILNPKDWLFRVAKEIATFAQRA
jgi:hypothetical protein